MRKGLVRRPSPATVIASIALFVSLGGVSYGVATGSIDSREIKNNDVRTKDLRNNDVRGSDIRTGTVAGSDVGSNTLTGADILESSLGTVPSAAAANVAATANSANSANTANTADNATSVGGVRVVRIASFLPDNNAETTVLDVGGFQIKATCSGASQISALTADTTAADGFLVSHSVDHGGEIVQNGVEDDTFDAADNTNLTPDVATPDELEFQTFFDDGTGASGAQVRAQYVVGYDDGSVDEATGCYVFGTAEVL